MPEGHSDIATCLNNLAGLYSNQGRYAQAKSLHEEALAIRRKFLPEEHSDIAQNLNDLALLYGRQGLPTKAEPLLVEALVILLRSLGNKHPYTVMILENYVLCLEEQQRSEDVECLFSKNPSLRETYNMLKLQQNGG